MTHKFKSSTYESFVQALRVIDESKKIYGYAGRPDSSEPSGYKFPVDGKPGWTYVRFWENGEYRGIGEALFEGAIPDPNLLVIMEREGGHLVVKRPDPTSATQLYKYLAPLAATGGVSSDLRLNSKYITTDRLEMYRVRAKNTSSLIAVVEPGMAEGVYWAGGEITLVSTSTSGKKAFVVITYDPVNNALSQTLASDLDSTFTVDQFSFTVCRQLLADVNTAQGHLRLAGVLLANGATTIDPTQIVDIREWLNPPPDPLRFRDATELTIASGVITPTQTVHTVDTESDDSTDDLDTITAPSPEREQWLSLRPANGARTVVIKHGTGNILVWDATDITLDEARKSVFLEYAPEQNAWLVRPVGGSGGGSGANTALSNLTSVAINTSLISDADSTDNLGSTANYWANTYTDTLYLSEQTAPSAPSSGKGVIYFKSDGKIYAKNAADSEYDLTVGSGGGSGGFTGYIILRDEKTANTNGGTFTSGSWQTRTLNTEVVDTGNHCSLSSNQFTLSAGTYRIFVRAPAYNCAFHKTRLRNITDSSNTLIGESSYCSNGRDMQTSSVILGRFTISGSKAFEVQHRCSTTITTTGFGVASNYSEIEVYTVVEIWRE